MRVRVWENRYNCANGSMFTACLRTSPKHRVAALKPGARCNGAFAKRVVQTAHDGERDRLPASVGIYPYQWGIANGQECS